MGDKNRGFILFPIMDPLHPPRESVEARLPKELYLRWVKYDPSKVREDNLKKMEATLKKPDYIFWGVREHPENVLEGSPPKGPDDFSEDWWCFSKSFEKMPHLVYVVYLSPRYTVYSHRREWADEQTPGAPRDWKKRYGGCQWPKT